MLKLKILPCTLLLLVNSVMAQQLPTAGSQMLQIPPTPVPPRTAPKSAVAPVSPTAVMADSAGIKILVKRLQLSGATAYSEAELLAVTGFTPGSELSLGELRAIAAKIAASYHRDGYFLAQAFLPEQDIKDGLVTITVLEGRYDKVMLRNESRVSDNVANTVLAGLDNGDLVAAKPLETRLLRLSDLPGV